MINFTQFVQQAMPEVERVAIEMAEHYCTTKRPLEEHFRCELISYYANGRIYETSHHSTWAGDMDEVIRQAKANKWDIDYDPENKSFRLEKHFASGMYRIATYTPYDKDKLDVSVH